MPNKKCFEEQSDSFKEEILGKTSRVIVCEAGVRQGWEGFVRAKKDLFTIDRFGASGPGKKVAEYLNFTAECLAALILQD